MIDNQPLISVIVPVYNGGKFLERCLDALFASDYQSFEVIVIDDGSTDDSAEISRKKGAVVLPSERRQSGPAAARNLAAAKAGGDILLFVDADVVVRRDTLAKIAVAFERQSEIVALFGSYDDAPAEGNFLSQYRNLLHHFVHQNSSAEASTFWAGLGAIRRETFNLIGGFDAARFPVPSIEDIELGARLRRRGHRILLDKNIQAKHLKKWKIVSLVRTDVFCRALPWSKLILTSQGLINDLNLKNSDRASAILCGLAVALFPLVFWQPIVSLLPLVLLLFVLFLNRRIFRFFYEKKGILFAAGAFPWQVFYFLYSGTAFVFCWFLYALPPILGFGKGEKIHEARHTN